ncbi:hypothetical protein GCM10011371_29220 [Novosphingobium marinum]|uniref:DNA-binding response OmpR family regulator n=1 Tax=Novosphingobium marinum TaxID=1514948 RepID=A0A7Z0BU83_9SPHN|nr:response regulator [Novosphingobium marinum]NYH96816.1 DNA-binding response OmpR family regulator [Novosphingobium marinum]GGC40031.1 hypothetical protein GCM10011371_29220 [Novosphingobium marinum]
MPHRTKAKILIVEDEFLVALQLEDMLLDAGYDVVGIVPDKASIATVGDAPDIALVDLNLRDGLSGPEIACRLSESHGTSIVYVTANPNQIERPAQTAVGVVQKPFSRDVILDVIAYAAAGAQPSGALPAEVFPIAANG